MPFLTVKKYTALNLIHSTAQRPTATPTLLKATLANLNNLSCVHFYVYVFFPWLLLPSQVP